MEVCILDHCTKPRYSVVSGMCRTHHHRKSLGYDVSEPVRGQAIECKHQACDATASAKGYCRKHYMQWNRTGKTWGDPPIFKDCVVEGCDRGVSRINSGLCQRHAIRGATATIKGDRSNWLACGVEGCTQTMTPHNKVCSRHRMRASQYGISHQEMIDLFRGTSCMACGKKSALAIHHDHNCCDSKSSCGDCVVGILCTPCNKAAGACGDDSSRLRKLADVLESGSWRARQGA